MELFDKVKAFIWGDPYDTPQEEEAFPGPSPVSSPSSASPLASEQTGMGRVMVFRPSDYVDSGRIVDYLCDGYLILLNLEQADRASLRRIVDFLSGAAYGRDGQMLRIAENTYLVVPSAVSLVDQDAPLVEEAPSFQLDAAFGF